MKLCRYLIKEKSSCGGGEDGPLTHMAVCALFVRLPTQEEFLRFEYDV